MLDVYVVSFNCARNLVSPESLAPSFFDALPKTPNATVPDVIAISLQEVAPIAYSFLGGAYLKPYFDRITTTVHLATDIRSNGSDRLEHVATRSLGMTALAIYAKPHVAERIQWIQSAGAGVGFWNMGNKGSVGIRLAISSADSDATLNLAFAAAHLAAHEANVKVRNADWENIVRNMAFVSNGDSHYSLSEEMSLPSSKTPPSNTASLFSPGSHLFFAGDLNYRTSDSPPNPKSHETYPQPTSSESSLQHFSHLLKKDQLNREREANRTLHLLQEVPINFPPTYKYSMRKVAQAHKRSASEPEANVRFEWAKHRYPSWCDRILFLPPPPPSRFETQMYTALPVQPTSDHRPVALSVRMDDKPLVRDAEEEIQQPFPLNPHWKSRQDAARRWELIVGVLSYVTLTKRGNAFIVLVASAAFTSWYVSVWMRR